MKFSTKFNLGDTVWFLEDNSVKTGQIGLIKIQHGLTHDPDNPTATITVISYYLKVDYIMFVGEKIISEHLVFASKKDLLNSL